MNTLRFLEMLLRAEIGIEYVRREPYTYPQYIGGGIVSNSRLIYLEEGTMIYQVEEATHELAAPLMLFVPAWVRRSWELAPGATCRLAWCEFSANLFQPNMRSLLWVNDADWALEDLMFQRMRGLWGALERNTPPPRLALRLEGEIKAGLARFFTADALQEPSPERPGSRNSTAFAKVENVLHWLEENFQHEDAATLMKEQTRLPEATFRRLFRDCTGFAPTAYLLSLRMRYARYLLHGTDLSVKETAAAAGFRDPLWFSKQYHVFWGYPPREERNAP